MHIPIGLRHKINNVEVEATDSNEAAYFRNDEGGAVFETDPFSTTRSSVTRAMRDDVNQLTNDMPGNADNVSNVDNSSSCTKNKQDVNVDL